MKKLKKSNKNRVVAGIFGGIGEYFDVDPTLLRLIGLFLFIFSGFIPLALVYIVAIFIVPKSEEQIKIDAEKPAYKKGWFWIFILIILLFTLPVIAFIIFVARTTEIHYEVSEEAFERGIIIEEEADSEDGIYYKSK